MNKTVIDIFTNSSKNAVEQGRCILQLKKIYEKGNPARFREIFLKCCLQLAKYDYKKNNPPVERSLKFIAAFCGNCYNSEEIDEVDQFVVDIIEELLRYHNYSNANIRFYISKIIRLIIEQITVQLRDDICDKIQETMFERMMDQKPAVREQAVLALMRLQRPEMPDCPVIQKYIERITSEPNFTVRKVLVQKVAMTCQSFPVIYKIMASVDAAVRRAAYLRCSLQEPQLFEIEQRQLMIVHIANDDNVSNRSVLELKLWPKWLDVTRAANIKASSKNSCNAEEQAPESDADTCLLLLNMLRLDEDVEQLQKTYLAYKVVLRVHFKITQIVDLIQALRLDAKKLIPLEYLTLESAFYWKYLFIHVQTVPTLDEYSDNIVAELTSFCEYVDKFVKVTFIDVPYDKFTWLAKQHTLLQLMQMVGYCDFNDDFGRERLKQLLSDILQNLEKIHADVLNIIIQIYCKIEKKFETVCEHICGFMTDIMQPYKVTPLHNTIREERDFTLAKLKFTLAMAQDSHASAIEATDYLQAGEYHKEVMSLRNQIAAVPNDAQLLAEHEMQQKKSGRREREPPSKNPEKHLRCCEMLSALVKLCQSRGNDIPPVLHTAKIELIDALLNNEFESHNDELYAKALEIMTYYGLLDKDIADIAIAPMSSPIISYRLIPDYNVQILVAALSGFTYLLVKYGKEILQYNDSKENDVNPRDNQESQSSNSSRLERITRVEDLKQACQNIDLEYISMEEFRAIILDMLDDENPTVSIHAAICITTLLKSNIAINSTVISKLLLMWFTPDSYEKNPKMLYVLSAGISQFGESNFNNIGVVMEEAAMITLRNIIEAPVNSSLYVCNISKCLQFLASITMMAEPNQSEIHRNLAQRIIPQLNSQTIDNRSKEIYSKFLSYMDPPLFDVAAVRRFYELLENTDTKVHKGMRTNIAKYLSKLRNCYNGNTTESLVASTQATINTTSAESHVTNSNILPSIIARPTYTQNLSRISEDNSSPVQETPLVMNALANSTPLRKSTTSKGRIQNPTLIISNDEDREISYHISSSDADSQHNDEQAPAINGIRTSDNETDVVISATDSEQSLHDFEDCEENIISKDTPLLRQSIARNKRLRNSENKNSSQDSDSGPPRPKRGRPPKKHKLKIRQHRNNNNNETIRPDDVCADMTELQIHSGSSTQGSNTSICSSRKRGRPSKQVKDNHFSAETHRRSSKRLSRRISKRLSKLYSSSSNDENCHHDLIRVNADIHCDMDDAIKSDTSSSTSYSSKNRPRKKSRLLPRSRNKGNIQIEQTRNRNGLTNRMESQLQSIENDINAIDIVPSSSSSEQEPMEFLGMKPRHSMRKIKKSLY